MISIPKKNPKGKVRYAVVGLGHIAQSAVLPAFAHAKENSELAALVSDDPLKHEKLGRQYGVRTYSYDEYEQCLSAGRIDAVYIALPNNLHCEYAVRAARAGVHVLCEKPMAVTEDECRQMIRAAEERDVQLMIAYRLHFEEANLEAVRVAHSGRLGDVRFFNSVFTMPVKAGDIRVQSRLGGGTLYDIGIYCVNAARYLFQAEPLEVFAMTASNGDERFREVEEMTAATLRFPGDRLATFTCSFSTDKVSQYQIVGTRGDLRVEPAYGYALDLKHHLTVDGKTEEKNFPKRDQFAPELVYFSNGILKGKYPEPSGYEGLADVRVIRALYRSAKTGERVKLADFARAKRPTVKQAIKRPAVKSVPPLVHAESPSGGK
jgi:predicted dehydrogenase